MEHISPVRHAKQGRRAAGNDDADAAQNGTGNGDGRLNVSPKPAKKQGAWGDDSKRRSRRKQDDDEADERLRPDAMISLNDDNDDIPVIPDLDEVNDEDLANQIAAPPSVQVTRVATYRELDSAFEKHAGLFTVDGGINLKLLAKSLAAESEIYEDDRVWDWERTFTEVASELQAEQRQQSQEDDDE